MLPPQDPLARLTVTEAGDVAVSYERVSREDQAKGTSFAKQTAHAEAARLQLGIPLVYTAQDDQTGRILHRKGLSELITLFEQGRANTLFIFDIDRLSRKFTGYSGLRETLHKNGVKIYLTESKRYLSPFAKDRLGDDVKGLVAEVEWDLIRQRSMDGINRKIFERNQVLAKGHPPYGYEWQGYKRDRVLVVNEQEADVVRLIFHLYVYGPRGGRPLSLVGVMEYLNDHGIPAPNRAHRRDAETLKRRPKEQWSTATLGDIIRRTAYYGEFEQFQRKVTKDEWGRRAQTRPKEERTTVPCPPIISNELYDLAAAKRATGATFSKRNTKNTYLLARRLVCECGYSFAAAGGSRKARISAATGKVLKDQAVWYRCQGTRKATAQSCTVSAKPVRQDVVDAAGWDFVQDYLTNAEWLVKHLRQERDQHGEDQRRLQEHIDALARQRDDVLVTLDNLVLAEAKASERLKSVYQRNIAEQEALLERYEKELVDLQPLLREELTDDEISATAKWVARFQRGVKHANVDERRQIIDTLNVRGIIYQVAPGTTKVVNGEELTAGTWIGLTCRLPIQKVLPLTAPRVGRSGRTEEENNTYGTLTEPRR